jgi:hypothetical protein
VVLLLYIGSRGLVALTRQTMRMLNFVVMSIVLRDFRLPRKVGENCTLMGYYAASSGISYRRFGKIYRSHLQGSIIVFVNGLMEPMMATALTPAGCVHMISLC